MATEGQLPASLTLNLFVCVRMEDGDEQGRIYRFEVTASGPSGQGTMGPGEFHSVPTTGPKLIDPERFYEVVPVEVEVDEGGQWTVTLADANGVRAVVPYVFSVFPSP